MSSVPRGSTRGDLLRLFSSASSPSSSPSVDINLLMTELNEAVAQEDYATAAALKKQIDAVGAANAAETAGAAADGEVTATRTAAKRTADGISDTKIGTPADWITVGAASWLAERLKDLGFRFATPCQANTLRAHIKLVIESGVESDGTEVDSSRFEEVWRDIALRAPTGSGKTIAYLASALTSVSRELYDRERTIFDVSFLLLPLLLLLRREGR